MPPSRNNTVKFSDLAPISAVGIGDLVPVVDTSVPTLVNKKINVQDFSRSLPVSLQVTQLGTNSASWDSTYSTTLANSASWSTGGSYGSVYSANSAEYESTYTSLNANSANWNSAYTTVKESSAAWVGLTTYTTVNSLSDTWNTGYALASSAYTTLSALSAGYWILKSGDQLTGALTTTRTVTANFTLDELVTKRYVDAMATATQISGNFVPSLYYTKANLETGIPLLSTTTLQFGQATMDSPGSSWSGSITFDKNKFGTDVPGFVLATNNPSLGNRAGLYIDGGTSGQFSFSQGAVGHNWNGPNFATVYNLTRAGGQRLSIYDDVNLNSNLLLRGSVSHSLMFDQWRSISFSSTSSRLSASNFTVEGSSVRFQDIGNPLNQNLTVNYNPGMVFMDVQNELFLRQAGSRRIGIYFQGDVDLGPGILRTAAANNSVGIGTTVPNEKLTVFGNISASGNITGLQIRSYHTTTSRYAYFDANADSGYSVIIGNSQTGIGMMCRGGVGQGIIGTNLVTRGYMAFSDSGLITTGSTPPQGQDLRLYRDDAYILAQRFDTNPNVFRIYNTYTDANNYERLSLSATRIAYEYAGTGVSRDLTIQSTGNIILSAGGAVNISSGIPTSFNSITATNYAIGFDGRISNVLLPAMFIQFAGNAYYFNANGNRTISITENFTPGNGGLWIRSDRVLGWSSSGNPSNSGDLRLKRIGASSLALDSGGTSNIPSFTVYGNISASGSVQTLSSFIVEQNSNTNEITPELTGMWLVRNTARHGIASTYQGTAISMLGFYYNNIGIGGIQQFGGFIVPSGAGFGWSNSSAGSLTYPYGRIGFYREGDFNIGLRPFDETFSKAGFSDASLKIYKMFTDTSNYERLALSGNRIAYEFAGTGVSRDLTIQSTGNIILSAGGVVNIGQSLPTMFNALSARDLEVGPETGAAQFSGVLRIRQAPGSYGTPGLLVTQNRSPQTTSIGGDVALATFGGGGYNNLGMSFTSNLLAQRILASPNPPQVTNTGSWQAEGLTDLALKVAGKVGFTVTNLDTFNAVRPVSAIMEYNWSNNLISLSSSAGKVGFRLEPVEAGNNRPEIYSDGNLFITNNFGGGRRIYFNGSQNQGWNPFELGYNGAFAYGTIEITATQQPGTGYIWPYLKITQDVKQLSNFIQAVSSNGSTILTYTSAGVLNLNSRIFLKPEGLIQFNSISSTTPAIKGTSTTIQARTGDDSQYTYLQGKLQTDQAASAGTFTPDKYIILYDSTGTAYKVPVQAL